MTIKLQLRVIVLVFAGLVAVLGWILISTFQQVNRATDRGRLANEIGRGVTDQKFLTSDFLLHEEARSRVQWNIKHDSLTLLLKQAEVEFNNPRNTLILNTISQRHASTKDVFSKLANALEKEGHNGRGGTGLGELGERLETQLLIASQEMVSTASQLAEGSRQDITDAQDRARWVVVAILTAMGIIAVTALLWLTKRVLSPIARLRSGTEIIGQGNLDYRIGITSRDEIGELSRAFDQMTSNLDLITASRDELNKEVTERISAEEQAKRSADEARFLSSTAQLAASTESVDEALEGFLDLICEYIKWPVGHLYVPSTNGEDYIEPTSVWHLDNPQAFQTFRQVTEQTKFAPGVGLPGRVFSSGEPAWIVDVQEDDNFPRNRLAADIGVRGAFGFPVKIGSETVAVLEFFNVEPMEADQQIFDIMRIVGSQIGGAIERARTREALQQQAQELSQSNSELEAFSYSVSHDLRAPLRAIDGFSHILMLEHSPQLPAQAQHYLDMVRQGAQQMGQLIDNLLAFSRLGRQQLAMRSVDLAPIGRQTFSELKRNLEGRRVSISIGDLPLCQGDPELIKEVLANLLSNALKYSKTTEDARIELGSQDREDSPGYQVYYVKDNGVGFDMRYADKLFGVFQRLHPSEDYEGTGVGLAIVQRIIHRHGGRVWAEAEVGKGATFYFTLKAGSNHDSIA